MVSPVAAILRFAAFLAITLVMLGPYMALVAIGWKSHSRYSSAYWRVVTRAIGIRVRTFGTPVAGGPALIVANHASYLDILVLGRLLPACFVAKREVAGWPGFGFLSRVAQTVFVERKRGGSARQRDLLRGRLDGGEMLILFPEGTSNDGNRVLPFKSALFAVAEEPVRTATGDARALPVQPVSVAYTRLDGLPLQRAFRPFYAWYGDMTLAGHLFTVLGLGQVTVDVIFHPPVTIGNFPDRKALASHCHDVIHHGVTLALAGRLPSDPAPGAVPARA
ncbi:MAG: lysophospholipid acyltransferase family protein [Magnetospirillum sp.]|nr:lysophospholipid acyltransferase family protein [Magnetospirillum sp.]